MSRTLATLTAVLGLFIVGATASAATRRRPASTWCRPRRRLRGPGPSGLRHEPALRRQDRERQHLGRDRTAAESTPMGRTASWCGPRRAAQGDANINIQVGPSRISALLRTLRDPKEACALVTFKATIEEAIERQVADAVAKRTAALEAELAALRDEQSARVATELASAIAERAMTASRAPALEGGGAQRRRPGGVGLAGGRARPGPLDQRRARTAAGAPVRVADLDVRDGAGKARGTAARLAGTPPAPRLLGVVAARRHFRGVAFVRDGASLLGAPLTLTVRTPDGRGEVTVRDLGIRNVPATGSRRSHTARSSRSAPSSRLRTPIATRPRWARALTAPRRASESPAPPPRGPAASASTLAPPTPRATPGPTRSSSAPS